MLAASLVVLLNLSSCKKYEDGPSFSLKSKNGRLTGEWTVDEIDKEKQVGSTLTLEFEKNGDFSYKYSYTDSYGNSSYSYDGEWDWEDGKKSVEVTIAGQPKTEWEILKLTNKELWFEDDYGSEWHCEKD